MQSGGYGGYPPPPGGDPQGGYNPQGGYAPQGGYQQPGYGYPPGYGYGGPPANYAGTGKRIGAYLLDSLMMMAASLPGYVLIFLAAIMAASGADARSGQLNDEAAGAFVGLMLLGYAVIFIGAIGMWMYQIYLLGRDGASLGKRWMKIKVVDPQGQPLGFGKAFLRELVKGVVGSVCFILLLWPLWDSEKQGLWDKVFSTHVYEA